VNGWVTASGLVLLAATVAGCGLMDARQQAVDRASSAVRAAAEEARREVEGALRAPGADPEEPVDRAARVLNEQIGKVTGGRVVRASARPDGTVELEGTFIELRDSGGGLSYETAAVLLCVRLTGRPGPQAVVELADAPCPTSTTSRPPNFGSIDKIVTLR
jgi:hypothetical protein